MMRKLFLLSCFIFPPFANAQIPKDCLSLIRDVSHSQIKFPDYGSKDWDLISIREGSEKKLIIQNSEGKAFQINYDKIVIKDLLLRPTGTTVMSVFRLPGDPNPYALISEKDGSKKIVKAREVNHLLYKVAGFPLLSSTEATDKKFGNNIKEATQLSNKAIQEAIKEKFEHTIEIVNRALFLDADFLEGYLGYQRHDRLTPFNDSLSRFTAELRELEADKSNLKFNPKYRRERIQQLTELLKKLEKDKKEEFQKVVQLASTKAKSSPYYPRAKELFKKCNDPNFISSLKSSEEVTLFFSNFKEVLEKSEGSSATK